MKTSIYTNSCLWEMLPLPAWGSGSTNPGILSSAVPVLDPGGSTRTSALPCPSRRGASRAGPGSPPLLRELPPAGAAGSSGLRVRPPAGGTAAVVRARAPPHLPPAGTGTASAGPSHREPPAPSRRLPHPRSPSRSPSRSRSRVPGGEGGAARVRVRGGRGGGCSGVTIATVTSPHPGSHWRKPRGPSRSPRAQPSSRPARARPRGGALLSDWPAVRGEAGPGAQAGPRLAAWARAAQRVGARANALQRWLGRDGSGSFSPPQPRARHRPGAARPHSPADPGERGAAAGGEMCPAPLPPPAASSIL